MSKTKWIIFGVFLGLVTLFGGGLSCYIAGRNAERAANQQQLADAEAEHAAERAEYQRTMENFAAGIGRVTAGLADAVGIAAGATDRGYRIAVLVDGIDKALRELGIIAGE